MKPTPLVLLVDDDAENRKVLGQELARAGMRVISAGDGTTARETISEDEFSLVLLDDNLPDVSAFDLCREIHEAHNIPVVMLAVVMDESVVVRALESCADDYVRKPYRTRELLARVRAVLRRSKTNDRRLPPSIHSGLLTLDSKTFRADISGEPLPLTPTEYRLLAFLVQNVGEVITHDRLLELVWGSGYRGEHHMLHVTMSRLRSKLAALSGSDLIRTNPGVGYEFVAETN